MSDQIERPRRPYVDPTAHVSAPGANRRPMNLQTPPVPPRSGCGPVQQCIMQNCEKWVWIDEADRVGGCGERVGAAASLEIVEQNKKIISILEKIHEQNKRK